MLTQTFMDLALALGLGLLVGLQKERARSPLAGFRTFALVTLTGAIAAVLGELFTPWITVAGLVAVVVLMFTGNMLMMKRSDPDPGQTTEMATVLMYLIGALVVVGSREIATVAGASVAVLLHLHDELDEWVHRLTDRDVRAIMQFVVISLVVLPLLPDQTYGPYDVINPRQVWLMVVLIVGLNLAGYGAFRVFGARAGTALAGLLGGVISSTATTMAYARHTKTNEGVDAAAVAVVWIASGVVFVRVLLEIGAVAPAFLPVAAGPLAVMLLLFIVTALVFWRTATAPSEIPMDPGNPSELKPAIIFGLLYAGILLVVAAAQDRLGDAGLYAAAALSGLTDVDAITLSTSRLVATERLAGSTGWRLILVAVMSNLVFKLGIATTLGSRRFARKLASLVVVALGTGVGLLLLWP